MSGNRPSRDGRAHVVRDDEEPDRLHVGAPKLHVSLGSLEQVIFDLAQLG